jgi:hypothetical protein
MSVIPLWRVGDRVELTVLQDGRVYGDCRVHAVHGLNVDVKLPTGRLYRLRADSSFLRRV